MKIVAFCGKKQSGKSSTAKFVCGNEMIRIGLIDNLTVQEDGDVGSTLSNGSQVVFDFDTKSSEAIDFYSRSVWPTVRKFSFADNLKFATHKIFGIPLQLLYGSDEDKNSITHIKLSDLYGLISINILNNLKKTMSADDFLSVRQILQLFGTNICRKMDDKCWVRGLISDVQSYGSELSLIDDCRFKNEVYSLREIGATLILFKKSLGNDSHISEKDLDDIDESVFDLVVDNSNMSLLDKNEYVMNWLQNNNIIAKSYQDSGITRAKLV